MSDYNRFDKIRKLQRNSLILNTVGWQADNGIMCMGKPSFLKNTPHGITQWHNPGVPYSSFPPQRLCSSNPKHFDTSETIVHMLGIGSPTRISGSRSKHRLPINGRHQGSYRQLTSVVFFMHTVRLRSAGARKRRKLRRGGFQAGKKTQSCRELHNSGQEEGFQPFARSVRVGHR